MAAVTGPHHPPGEYEVVVVGSGPGGLQTGYCLGRLGVHHAVLSADDAPGGMFRRWPVFQRLISWSKPEAPAARASADYERYDHNSLVADEAGQRALVPAQMGRDSIFPARAEMQAGLRAFVDEAGVRVRFGCRWESTRVSEDGLVLETTDGEYRCRFAVFAVGMTEPWTPDCPGIEEVPHYAATRSGGDYRGRTVLLLGKRNSAFELADGLLPWARRIVLVSPRAVDTAVLAHATVRPRYLQPLEESALGGGVFAVDAAVERIERTPEGGFAATVSGTTRPGGLVLEADAAIAATGFRVPLADLPRAGLQTITGGRVPALTPYWESMSLRGAFFAGGATVGASGLRRLGVGGSSASVAGFRYNARVLARYLAERLGRVPPLARPVAADEVAPLLAAELRRSPELWAQKGYLARLVELDDGGRAFDRGVHPLRHVVDEGGPEAVAVTIETDPAGVTYPGVYVRRGGDVVEHHLDPQPLHEFDGEPYVRALAALAR